MRNELVIVAEINMFDRYAVKNIANQLVNTHGGHEINLRKRIKSSIASNATVLTDSSSLH